MYARIRGKYESANREIESFYSRCDGQQRALMQQSLSNIFGIGTKESGAVEGPLKKEHTNKIVDICPTAAKISGVGLRRRLLIIK